MSHIVKCTVEVKDAKAMLAAAAHLGLQSLGFDKYKLFSAEVSGYGFKLPGWNYAIVIDPTTGALHYDNYDGAWGDQIELDKFLQRYSVETAVTAAQSQGFSVEELQLGNGDVELRLDQPAY